MQGKLQQHNHKSVNRKKLQPRRKSISQIILLGGLLVIVCVVAAAAHWPALPARALSFDDHQYLHNNQLVQNPSWTSAWRFLSEVFEPSTVGGYYQPLAMISLMFDCAVGGGPDNLRPFHVTSLSLHVLNTALVIVLLYMLFGKVWPAAMVGLLFGVHPLTIEPIPWIGERKTLLASFFALWCIITYVYYSRKSSWKLYAGCVMMYVLALMAKPTTTPLPVLLLLLDFWPLRRLTKRALLEKVPLLIIALVFAVITLISQSRTAEVAMPTEHGPMRILLILCHNIIFYLHKIIWPVNLSSHYPFPEPLSVSNSSVLAGVIGTCILIPALLVSLRWTRALLTGWLFFFVGILPTMGVIGFTIVIASDKYAYLPSFGLLMILAWTLGWLWGRISASLVSRITIVIFILAVAFSEFVATRRYLVYWQETESYIRYMCKLTPHSARLQDFLGVNLTKQGKNEEAESHFAKALSLNPNYYRAHINLGIILAKRGDLEQATTHFVKAVELNPSNERAHYNLALALLSKGNIKGAIKHFRESLHLKPTNSDSLTGLSWILATHRKAEFRDGAEAARLARQACELTNYKNPETLNSLAAAYAELGQFTEAVKTAQKAIDLCLSSGNKKRAKDIANLQRLYKAGRPCRAN